LQIASEKCIVVDFEDELWHVIKNDRKKIMKYYGGFENKKMFRLYKVNMEELSRLSCKVFKPSQILQEMISDATKLEVCSGDLFAISKEWVLLINPKTDEYTQMNIDSPKRVVSTPGFVFISSRSTVEKFSRDGKLLREWKFEDIKAIQINIKKKTLYVVGAGKMTIINIESEEIINEAEYNGYFKDMTIDIDEEYVWCIGENNVLMKWDVSENVAVLKESYKLKDSKKYRYRFLSYTAGKPMYIEERKGKKVDIQYLDEQKGKMISVATFSESRDSNFVLISEYEYLLYTNGQEITGVDLKEVKQEKWEEQLVYRGEDDIKDFTFMGETLYILDEFMLHICSHTRNPGYEEDMDDVDSLTSDPMSVTVEVDDVKSCVNTNLITLEDYTEDDEPIIMYTPDSNGKFQKAICSTKEELVAYFEAFRGTSVPDNIMTIYTTPNDYNVSGYGGQPTGRIVVKMPVNNIYITLGSMKRMLHEKTSTWYAIPLFGGKRRRVGNLKGLFGSSMNHGQIQGFVIYKVYSKKEIDNKVEVKETQSDYPKFLVENTRTLYEIVGEDGEVDVQFVNGIIDEIIS
jgi:hypothetical protein